MKILHIGKYYAPYAGGMESVVRNLCEGQVMHGHEVTVLCYNDKNTREETSLNGVNIVRLARFAVVAGQPIAFELFQYLRESATSYDLIHVHTPNPLAELFSLLIPSSVAIVATHHSDIVRQKSIAKYYLPFYRKFLAKALKVFVPTQNHIDYSSVLPEFASKCDVIPFGIRTDHLKKEDISQEINERHCEYGNFALCVGRLVGYKGVDVLIHAAAETNYHVVIVGEGPEREQLEKLVHSLGLEKRVHLLGKVTDDKTFRSLYHACKFLVLPSITVNENFGVTQLEAMACSKAVITTKLESGVPAVGVPGKTTFLTTPGSSQELASCMTMLMENESLCEMMGRAGFKRFQELYRFDKMIDSTLDSYERTVDMNEIAEKHRKKVA